MTMTVYRFLIVAIIVGTIVYRVILNHQEPTWVDFGLILVLSVLGTIWMLEEDDDDWYH